jgi:ACS family glucarate transporter-like MFS transporter
VSPRGGNDDREDVQEDAEPSLSTATPTTTHLAAPTRARRTLLRLMLALSVITYFDRIAISSASPTIVADLHLTSIQMGWIFSAFTFAYAAFEIPSGWLGDVLGPRKVLARIVLWWSAFTALTGAAWNFTSLLAMRFLFGAGEAGAFPNMSRSLSRWIPSDQRGDAHGQIIMGTRLGGAVTPLVMAPLMSWLGWRASFAVLGVIGVIWCACWLVWFRDDPAEHPSVNADELAMIRRGQSSDVIAMPDWRALLSARLLLICLMYFCVTYALYFNLTWLPLYLRDARGFSGRQAALGSAVVLLGGAVGTWAGGRLTDWLARHRGLRVGRAIGAVALRLSGVLVLLVAYTDNRVATVVLLTLTLAAADLVMAPSWSLCHDVGGARAGAVTGAMNTFGNLGGAISPLVVGYAVHWWQSWTVPFFVTAGVYVIGGLLTLAIDPTRGRPRWMP